jgi:UDP-N-acetyl-D-mannosaminuronic acid dehydrogenase
MCVAIRGKAVLVKIVVLGGGGHVGLPLALVLAEKGCDVTSLDISAEVVNKINSGEMPFFEQGAEELLEKNLKSNNFIASTDFACIASAEVVIVVIGTPVDEHLNPNPNSVVEAIRNCVQFMNNSQSVILRSTVYPGVTKKVQALLKENGLSCEVSFCPERILEGHAVKELLLLPQIIGADTEKAQSAAEKVFNYLGIKTITVSTEEAELAKLFTNVWRYIKFAAANQFWLMSNEAGLNYSAIRKAVTFDYPRAADLPNAGFSAGPCLFKDTMQLAAHTNNNFALGHSAMLVNEGLPHYIISKLERQYNLAEMKVGILGMAFKGDSDDIRSSLSYKLKKILEFKSAKVLTSDPFVTVDKTLLPQEVVVAESDLLIIGAPHTVYSNLKCDKKIIDIWNLLGEGNLI